jgi:protein-S-isoprenylcysteine O-methyltransferase Ste14
MKLFFRALASFLILPGTVAGVFPVLILWGNMRIGPHAALGLFVAAVGLVLLLWCVRDFYVSGKGTLAPWDPPKGLVVVGLYRYVRNPMYVGVLTLLMGWAITFGSKGIGVYLVSVALVFHVRVLTYEEPVLSRMFGQEWQNYRDSVPRWLPFRRLFRSRG